MLYLLPIPRNLPSWSICSIEPKKRAYVCGVSHVTPRLRTSRLSPKGNAFSAYSIRPSFGLRSEFCGAYDFTVIALRGISSSFRIHVTPLVQQSNLSRSFFMGALSAIIVRRYSSIQYDSSVPIMSHVLWAVREAVCQENFLMEPRSLAP